MGISGQKIHGYILTICKVGNVVLMPVVNEKADDVAAEQLKEFLQVESVIQIDSCELTFEASDGNIGGSLHCISWNVFDSSI